MIDYLKKQRIFVFDFVPRIDCKYIVHLQSVTKEEFVPIINMQCELPEVFRNTYALKASLITVSSGGTIESDYVQVIL